MAAARRFSSNYRLVAMYGWDDMIFTTFPRVPGPEHHFCNPYGMLFEEITASSLVKVDLEGNIVWTVITSSIRRASPFTQRYMARDDAHCVLHLHTDDGVAVSAQDDGLLPLSQFSMLVRPHLTYHGYEGVALNHDERERIVADLGDKNLMLLRNHGTLAVGENCGLAFIAIYFLERACATQVRALTSKPHMPSQEAIDTVESNRNHCSSRVSMRWHGLPYCVSWTVSTRHIATRLCVRFLASF